jgi:hypothetical protein
MAARHDEEGWNRLGRHNGMARLRMQAWGVREEEVYERGIDNSGERQA